MVLPIMSMWTKVQWLLCLLIGKKKLFVLKKSIGFVQLATF